MKHNAHSFYVYEHWRPDKDVCFYVGKGKGQRAYTQHGRSRNKWYARVTAKLARLGMCVEVRMVADSLTEESAWTAEIERIKFWRASGVKLANQTDGGEGSSGIKYSKERRALISTWVRNLRHSEETKARMSEIAKARAPISKKQKAKIAKALQERWNDPDYRAHMIAAHLGYEPTVEARANMCLAQRSRAPRSVETKAKTSASIKAWHARRKAQLEGAS